MARAVRVHLGPVAELNDHGGAAPASRIVVSGNRSTVGSSSSKWRLNQRNPHVECATLYAGQRPKPLEKMTATLREIESRLLAVMPIESTIDRPHHALAIATVVFEARRQATGKRQEWIAATRSQVVKTEELTRLLKNQMRERTR